MLTVTLIYIKGRHDLVLPKQFCSLCMLTVTLYNPSFSVWVPTAKKSIDTIMLTKKNFNISRHSFAFSFFFETYFVNFRLTRSLFCNNIEIFNIYYTFFSILINLILKYSCTFVKKTTTCFLHSPVQNVKLH